MVLKLRQDAEEADLAYAQARESTRPRSLNSVSSLMLIAALSTFCSLGCSVSLGHCISGSGKGALGASVELLATAPHVGTASEANATDNGPSCPTLAFRRILASKVALATFHDLSMNDRSSTAGRLYGLAGLRVLDSSDLVDVSETVKASTSTHVRIAVGDEMATASVDAVVRQILKGDWPLEVAGRLPFSGTSPAGRP